MRSVRYVSFSMKLSEIAGITWRFVVCFCLVLDVL